MTDMVVRPNDAETASLDLAETHVAVTGGVDAAIARTVDRRALIPTERQVAAGEQTAAYDFRPVEDELPPPRRTFRQLAGRLVRDADPRSVGGPALPLALFSVAAFMHQADRDLFTLLLPEIRDSFKSDLGFLVGIYSALLTFSLILAPPAGYLADRAKRVLLVRISSVIGLVTTVFAATAPSLGQFAGARAAGIAGGSVEGPVEFPLLSDYYPTQSRARVFAFYQLAGRIGTFIAPLVGGVLAATFGWRTAFLVLGALGAVIAVGSFFLKEPVRGYYDRLDMGASEEVAKREQKAASFAEATRALLAIATMRRLFYALPFLTVADEGVRLLMPFYYREVFHMGPADTGYMVAGGAAIGVVGLIFAGPVSDRLLVHKPGRVLGLLGATTIAQAGALFTLAWFHNLWLALVLIVPIGFTQAMVSPAVLTIASLVVPARVRGLGIQSTMWPKAVGVMMLPAIIAAADNEGLPFGMVYFVPILVLAGIIVASSGLGVERDMRAARAASMAEEESRRARLDNRNKMLVCRDVDVEYGGVKVLFGVDFDVEEGEVVALVGTNGAGKSTLLRAIAGVQEASNGAIFLDGTDITHAPPYQTARNGVVFMPGGNAVFPTSTVEDNLRAAAWMYRDDEDYVRERVEQVLGFFPVLRDRLHDHAGNLSGGEQQMVGLGQAFLMKPRLLMIDELSLGLAPAIVSQLLDIIREVHRQGTTVVLVEQSLNVAMTIANRAVFMEKGQVRFSGPTEELLSNTDLVRSVFMGGAASGGTRSRRRVRAVAEAALPALDVQDVAIRFGGVQALRGAAITVAPGEIVGIIGPNGAGKTTLFDVISGFLAPDRGRVLIEGADVTSLAPDARARLGLCRSFQNARLFPSLTVAENIAVAFERRTVRSVALAAVRAPNVRRSEARIHQQVDDLLELLGLEAFANKFVAELSTGSRRAVDIACVMAAEPKLLLLDEPSSGLAQAETEDLGPVLTRLVRETGCGLLVIEHDMPLVTSISDTLVAMELGAVLASGVPEQVVNHPDVQAAYLKASDAAISRSDVGAAAIRALVSSTAQAADEISSSLSTTQPNR
jgi:branched-chain amino acid transport system ATP-binding protein